MPVSMPAHTYVKDEREREVVLERRRRRRRRRKEAEAFYQSFDRKLQSRWNADLIFASNTDQLPIPTDTETPTVLTQFSQKSQTVELAKLIAGINKEWASGKKSSTKYDPRHWYNL